MNFHKYFKFGYFVILTILAIGIPAPRALAADLKRDHMVALDPQEVVLGLDELLAHKIARPLSILEVKVLSREIGSHAAKELIGSVKELKATKLVGTMKTLEGRGLLDALGVVEDGRVLGSVDLPDANRVLGSIELQDMRGLVKEDLTLILTV